MASVADAFKEDLEVIRKVRCSPLMLQMGYRLCAEEPNMTTSRLAMLIDSLAAGGDVPAQDATEIEIVLERNT